MQATPPSPPSFREALGFWLRLGFISFGGPAGQIAIMHDFLVDKKRWISNSKFLHALNYCMLLPGPEAQQLAIYTGWMLHGTRGGLVAGIFFILPAVVILWILSVFYSTFGQIPVVQAAFEFLKPAVVAIVAGALVKIGTKSLYTVWHSVVAIAAFVAIYFFNVPFPAILLGALLMGATTYFWENNLSSHSKQAGIANEAEHHYYINHHTPTVAGKWSIGRLFQPIGVALVLWCIPLLVLSVYTSNFAFWKTLIFFFTKAALVTFGGAYAVLPYVAQVSVEQFKWLTRPEMLDGLALGETTPGPLIIVLAYIGFMAGFNTFGGSILAATTGLLITVWYTFLPSFLFVLAGAPIIERTHSNQAVKSILRFVSAAVVGVILNLCIYLGQAVITPQPPAVQWLPLAWVVVSLVAIQYFKTNLMVWIGISMVLGLGRYFLS